MHTAQQGLGPCKNHSEALGTAPSHSKGHADGCRCFVGKTKQGKPSSTQARTHTMSTPIPSFIHGNPGLMHFLKKKGTGDRKRTKKGKGAKTCKNGKERNRTSKRKKERKKKRKKESKKERKKERDWNSKFQQGEKRNKEEEVMQDPCFFPQAICPESFETSDIFRSHFAQIVLATTKVQGKTSGKKILRNAAKRRNASDRLE